MASLIEKIHQASGFQVAGVEKEDLIEAVLEFYKKDDRQSMGTLFREYANFLYRSSEKPEEQMLERARGNIRFVSYAADLMNQNCLLFEAVDKAAKQSNDARCGPAVDFFNESTKDYALVKMPGFRAMYNGALYSRRLTSAESQDGIYELLLMTRYTVPVQEEIMEHLQQKKLGLRATKDNVDTMLKEKGIVSGKAYIDIAYGRLPNSFLQQNVGNIKGLNWYELALRREAWQKHSNFGLQWALRSLPYHDTLPPRASVQMELPGAEAHDAAKSIDAVYAALSTPLHFGNVLDSSNIHLEYLASELHDLICNRLIEKGLQKREKRLN